MSDNAVDREPCFRQVQDALVDQIEAACPHLNLFVDRSDAEPLNENEIPGQIVRMLRVGFENAPDGMAQTLCRAIIHVDFISGMLAGETMDVVNQRAIADFIAALHADRYLGGRLAKMIEESAASGTERDGADIGCTILELEAVWFIPRGDFYTIVGQGGQLFTS